MSYIHHFWGDRPDDATAVELPWYEIMTLPEVENMPTKSWACFSAFLRGERVFDDGGALPVYERAYFWAIPGAAECRERMFRSRHSTTPAIVPVEWEEAEVHG